MMTWVLVLILVSSRGDAMTNIPGYTSPDSCNAAGAAYVTRPGQLQPRTIAYCIPGPDIETDR